MKTFIIFAVLNVINVILQTAKSILTYKGNKYTASIANAVAYAVYTVVLVYMTCELSTIAKALIVGGCNLIGVYIVKSLEQRKIQTKCLYKVEFTVQNGTKERILAKEKLTHYNCYDVGENMTVFNFYVNKDELKDIKKLINRYDGKYIITEGKQF